MHESKSHCALLYIQDIILYRPPPSKKNKLTPKCFFDEFENFLAEQILAKGKLLIMGDLNLHLDQNQHPDSHKFLGLLESYGLQQLVKEPTHRSNHILDVIITRTDDCPVHELAVTDSLISDHKSILLSLNTQKPPIPKKVISYRTLKKVIMCNFRDDIKNSPLLKTKTNDVEQLVLEYNQSICAILDKHAPVKTRTITIKPAAPWYTNAVDMARKEKRQCERKWRATGLTIHRQLFINARNVQNFTIAEAKKCFFKQKISESANHKKPYFPVLMNSSIVQ